MDRRGFLSGLLAIPAAIVGRHAAPEVVHPDHESPPQPIQVTTIIETGGVEVERIERELVRRAAQPGGQFTQFSMRCINQIADCYGIDVGGLR